MRAKYIALTSTVKIELADGRGREAFCFPNTATISPPSPPFDPGRFVRSNFNSVARLLNHVYTTWCIRCFYIFKVQN